MAAPIPPLLKYSIVYNLLNFPPMLIKFMPTFIVWKVLYFKVQYRLRLRSPLKKRTPTLTEHMLEVGTLSGIKGASFVRVKLI